MERVRADVCVVGAGFAGLAAARHLSRAGQHVVVLEARERVGGRTWNREMPNGLRVSVGGTWLGTGHDRMFELCREVGVATYDQYARGDHLIRIGDDNLRFTKAPKKHVLGLATYAYALRRLSRLADRLPPERPWDAAGAADLDAQTLADWIGSRRNVPHPLGRDLTTMAMTLLFSVDPAEVSVLGALVLARGGPRAKRGFEYYTDSSQTETHLIDGDPATVAERIAAALGDDVHVGCPVRHIRHHERGVEVVGDDLTVDADRVIVAAPPSLAARIQFSPSLPAAHNHLMLRMTPGTAVRVITTYEQPFWRASGLCGETSDPRSPVVITIDQCPMSGTPGVLSSYAFGPPAVRLASMSPSDRRGTWLAELAKRFGPQAAEPTGYLETDWTAEEWSRGGMTSHFAPGVLTNYGTALREPVGRIHWAGAERATEMYGLIEGAVRSGERAAGEVLRA